MNGQITNMSFIIPEELRFPTPTSKSHIEQCGKIFSMDFEKSINKILSNASLSLELKIKNTKSFHEKQLLSDLKKKFSQNINKIGNEFRKTIEIELANQLSLDKRLHGKPIWWKNIISLDKEEFTYKDTIERFKFNLGENTNKSIEELKKRVSCLIGEEQNLFGVDVIIRSLVSSLKKTIDNPVSLFIAIDVISNEISNEFNSITEKINSYLIKNNVLVDIDEYKATLQDMKKLPKSYGWEGGEGDLERKTTSRHSTYGSIAIPVDLTLPSLDDFLSGRSTIMEESRVAVPKFQPTNEIINKNEQVNIDSFKKSEVNHKPKESSWVEHIDKVRRIIDIQKKGYKAIDYRDVSVVSNYEAEIKVTESNLIKNDAFINETQELQKNIRRIDFFEDDLDRLDINIFSEIMKNDEIKKDMSSYDIYILKVLEKLFSSIINNPEYSLSLKSIFYKLQIPLWHRILLDKTFLMSKNTPARILFDLLLSTEVIFNERCTDFAEKIISKASYRLRKSSEYFSLILENIIAGIEKNKSQEDEEIVKITKDIEVTTNETVLYNRLKSEIESNMNVKYEPLNTFVFKIWLCGFIKTFYLDNSTPEQRTKDLSPAGKLCWQQAIGTFESLNWISQNKAITTENLNHTKDLFSKINLIMPKVCMESGIDINYSKALIALIKYRSDSLFKTSNPVAIKDLLDKIIANEETFNEAGDAYFKSIFGDTICSTEDYSSKLKSLLTIDNWYIYDGEMLKLKYFNKNYTKIIFIRGDELRKLVEKTGIKLSTDFEKGDIRENIQSINRAFLGILSNINLKLTKETE